MSTLISEHTLAITDGVVCSTKDPYLSGFSVYKRYEDRKRYQRDLTRRCRNLKVVETRFPKLLRRHGVPRKCGLDALLLRVMSHMNLIRPQLLQHLKEHPDSLTEKLSDFFGVPICIRKDSSTGVSTSADSGIATDEVPSRSLGVETDESKPTQQSDPWLPLLSLLLSTLLQKYDTVSALEDEIDSLYRQNTDLLIMLQEALHCLSSIQIEHAQKEEAYLADITKLTEAEYVSSRKISSLKEVAHRKRNHLDLQRRKLFKTENLLAMQCYLNCIPCPTFGMETEAAIGFAIDSNADSVEDNRCGMYESFVLNDKDCSTSAYNSDVPCPFDDPVDVPSSAQVIRYSLTDSHNLFDEADSHLSPFMNEDAGRNAADELSHEFSNGLNLSIGSAAPGGQPLPNYPTVPAIPPPQAVVLSPGSIVPEDTKVRELQAEIAVLQRKLRRYIHEIRKLKRTNELLKQSQDAADEITTNKETATVAKREIENVDVGIETAPLKEDTKVKELKAEISVLQKQIQRYIADVATYRHIKERLVSEESKNQELQSDINVLQRKLALYRNEADAILLDHKVNYVTPSQHRQSSTMASGDNELDSRADSNMSEVRNAFSSLRERLYSCEAENDALNSQIQDLNHEIEQLRRDNAVLSSDTKAAEQLTLGRLLHTITDALDKDTRNSLEEMETTCSEGSSSSDSHTSCDDILDERTRTLECENSFYKEKLCNLHKALHESSLESIKMKTTIERLSSDFYNAQQQIHKFRKQSKRLGETSNELELTRAKCGILEEQVDKLKQMNTDLSDLNNRLNDDVRSLEERSSFTSNEVIALKEENKQLQSLLMGGQPIPHDAIRSKVAIIQLEGRCKLLDEYLSSCRAELDSVRLRNADLVKCVMEMRYSLEQERTTNVEKAKQIVSMLDLESRLRNQVDLQHSQIEGLKASVASLNESLEKSSSELSEYSSWLNEKEKSERSLSSRVSTLESALKTLLTSVMDVKPFFLSPGELGAIDLGGIKNFDIGVYCGVVDAIQKSMVGGSAHLDNSPTPQAITSAKEKISNVFRCNYLLGTLASGLCSQLQKMSEALLSRAHSEGSSLSAVIQGLSDQVNGNISRADLSGRFGRLHAHIKELNSQLKQINKSNPAEAINRLKEQHNSEVAGCKSRIEQLNTVLKAKEDEQMKLRQENLKLVSDCSAAAQALMDFETRLDSLLKERSSLCQYAIGLLPLSVQSECSSDNPREILTHVRNHISNCQSYKEKYQKLLANPPEPKAITATPTQLDAPKQLGVPTPVKDIKVTQKEPTSSYHHIDESEQTDKLNGVIMDIDSNVRYYLKSIRSALRGHLRDLANHQDTSDTDYESPHTRSVGRSDTTLDDADLEFSDSESEEPNIYKAYDRAQGEELIRLHTRQFDGICDMLDKLGKSQAEMMNRSPKVIYINKPTPSRHQNGVVEGDMAVMHHFSRLCTALKEFVAGSPLSLTIDDVFYQMELVMLDSGDREHRRALWNRSIGDMVQVIIEVLKCGTIERSGRIEELERRCQVVYKALDEANSLCRIREDELQRRTAELRDTCECLEQLQQRCRKLEVELDTRVNERPTYEEHELRALESELSYREDEIHRLSKELSKLHSVVLDLEDINNLLSQQLERARSEINRLDSTVDSQQRQISSLNTEISHLELEAERMRRAFKQPSRLLPAP